MTALNTSIPAETKKARRLKYRPLRNFLIILVLAVHRLFKYAIRPAVHAGMTVGEFYARFNQQHRLFTTMWGGIGTIDPGGYTAPADIMGWGLHLALLSLAVGFIAELGRSRDFEPDGENPVAAGLWSGALTIGSAYLRLTFAGMKYLLIAVFIGLCGSVFVGFAGIYVLCGVNDFLEARLALPLHFLMNSAGKYLIALPLIDWAVQKLKLVRRCIYLPLVFISAALNGICILYYRCLDGILAGMNLAGSASLGAMTCGVFLMYIPLLLVIYFTMTMAINAGRKAPGTGRIRLRDLLGAGVE